MIMTVKDLIDRLTALNKPGAAIACVRWYHKPDGSYHYDEHFSIENVLVDGESWESYVLLDIVPD